jgi:ribosomal protein L40E
MHRHVKCDPGVLCSVGGVWATFPVLFPTATVGFYVQSVVTVILSFSTLFNYCMAAFRVPGPSPRTEYGKYDLVGKKSLEGYKFCVYCKTPKPPNAHHCRSCESCVVDMDHHCPFVINLTLVFIFPPVLHSFIATLFLANQSNHLGIESLFQCVLHFSVECVQGGIF